MVMMERMMSIMNNALELSDSQQDILEKSLQSRSTLILSGPGSGKTRLLTKRIVNLLEKHTPDSFWMVTFTNQAAKEMRTRVSQALNKTPKDIWISTFHSGFARILRENKNYLDNPNFNIIAEETSQHYIKDIYQQITGQSTEWKIKEVVRVINFCKENMITPDEYRTSCSNDEQFVHQQVYETYQNKLYLESKMDFGDLQMKAVQMIKEHPQILDNYSGIKFIMVDEFQDINHTQLEFLKLFAKDKQVCVVGDLDQSIFAFRGSNPQYALSFSKLFPDSKILKMEESHRCSKNIADCANSLIKANTSRIHKQISTARSPGTPVYVVSSQSEFEEDMLLLLLLQRILKKGGKFSDIAFLTRTNQQSDKYRELFDQHNIPYYSSSNMGFWETAEGNVLYHLLSIITGNASTESYQCFLSHYPKVGKQTINLITDEVNVGHKWREVIGAGRARTKQGNASLQSAYEWLTKLETIDHSTVMQFIDDWINQSAFQNWLKKNKKLNIRVENINQCMRLLSKHIKDNATQPVSKIMETFLNQSEIQRQGIALLTIHASKGLEFKTVFIPGVEYGNIPSFYADTSDLVEEERRLLYVAITRAKDHLFLTHTKKRNGKDANPSPFLHDIKQHLTLLKRSDIVE